MISMANVNNSGNNRYWQGCNKEDFFSTLENNMEVPQKIKKRTTLQASNFTVRHLSKGYRYAVSTGHMYPKCLYSSTINNSKSMERAQMAINR